MKNIWSKQITLIILGILVIGASFFMGFSLGLSNHPSIEKVTVLDNKEASKPANVDFAPFWKAWSLIEEKHVSSATSTSDQDKVWGAIEGLTASLKDPYTVFFPPENAKLFQSEISGTFSGVGMEVGFKDNIITVIAPLKNTPAAKAGILSGDKILKIDESDTTGMKVDQAIKLIRGEKGTEVVLTVFHEGGKAPVIIKIIRDTIAIPTVDTELRQQVSTAKDGTPEPAHPLNDVFVIRLYSFSATSPDLFRESLRKFIESGSTKLILDLRGNPGGYLEAAVDMASWFLPAGKVIVSEDFGKNAPEVVYRSKGYNVFNNQLKFAILVNGGSASASEILAGALQEHGIARLVGSTTFGKGSVQELVDVTSNTSLKVTVARWLTPKGNSISLKGITPDLVVPMSAEDFAKKGDVQLAAATKLLLKQ